MNTLGVEISVPSKKADLCRRALEMETQSESLRRSKISIENKEDSLLLDIEADDLSALRASMNTYLRWADMCLKLIDEG
ncbi:MAG: hypothetical protein JW778_06290 [Candidatus Altiarchaeota archaeon]|nr:hypothetical protein [Candidatus Altiarchaeota archaeon]